MGEEPAYIYVLFEHKSSADPSTLLQLLGPMIEIWRPFGEQSASRLPHILPIIVYHGGTEWTAPRAFSDYFADDGAATDRFGVLDRELRPLLLDLSSLSEAALDRLSAVSRSDDLDRLTAAIDAFVHAQSKDEVLSELRRS